MAVMGDLYDLLVIGGGINGVCIARDAAGRGLRVVLCEQGDLAGATSSASSKLIHGGLRYLEHFEFRLVREALRERELLLANALHLIHPMRFVLPATPTGRPAWLVRCGLWLYDHLGGRRALPGSQSVDLARGPFGEGLISGIEHGFVYSDCWVDDARFVVLNAVDAARRGAEILTRTRCVEARRDGRRWHAKLAEHDGGVRMVQARALVNAAGPWVRHVLTVVAGRRTSARLRLVKGSHIVVPRLYAGDHAFLLQNDDGRVVFVIPFEDAYSLIGTTDVPLDGEPGPVAISAEETEYLCRAVNRYFAVAIGSQDVVWSFAGVRPLYDDGRRDPSKVTRDYVLEIDAPEGEAPIVSVFGGKITTARRLAERVVGQLDPPFLDLAPPWTAEALLPGGEMDDFEAFVADLVEDHPGFCPGWLRALGRRHGTYARAILDGARSEADLGLHFGAGLYAAEVDWFMRQEWAREVEDVLWRRTKCGLGIDPAGRRALADYMASRRSG